MPADRRRYYQEHKDVYRERHRLWRQNPENLAKDRKYYREVGGPRKYWRRQIIFKNRRVTLWDNVRTGQCSICKRHIGDGINSTVMHHAKGYFEIFPWFGIEELCRSCHFDQHPYVRSMGGTASILKRKSS